MTMRRRISKRVFRRIRRLRERRNAVDQDQPRSADLFIRTEPAQSAASSRGSKTVQRLRWTSERARPAKLLAS
jgi:hypothetical protein